MLCYRVDKKWAKPKESKRVFLFGGVTKRSRDSSRQGAPLNELIELASRLIILFFLSPLWKGRAKNGRKGKDRDLSFGVSALTNDLLVDNIHRKRRPFPFCKMRAASAVDSTLSSFLVPAFSSASSLVGAQ